MAWTKKKKEPEPVAIIEDEVAEEEPSAVPVLDKYEEKLAEIKRLEAEIEAEKKKIPAPKEEDKITVITENQAIMYELAEQRRLLQEILKIVRA